MTRACVHDAYIAFPSVATMQRDRLKSKTRFRLALKSVRARHSCHGIYLIRDPSLPMQKYIITDNHRVVVETLFVCDDHDKNLNLL